MEEIRNKKSEIRLPVLMAIAISVGIFIGASFMNSGQSSDKVTSNMSKFKEVLVSIDRNYVDNVNTSDLTDQAIREMLTELDPHSDYIPSEEAARLNAQIQGSYEGIGIQFDIISDTVYVVKPLQDGPSMEAGLKIGDKIIKVEEENIAGVGIGNEGVTGRLLGSAGSTVNISVLRGEDVLDFTIKRGEIPQRSVTSAYMIDDKTGYIKISRFGSRTYEEFVDELEALIEKGMTRLMLDLQNNPGGLMSAAEKISDEMLSGKKLIVDQKSAHNRFNASTYARQEGLFEEGPVILLVNEYSASASEIVAGAMQDHDRALVVGRRTFGKGLVQMPITLNDRSELRLTIARYYTPSGRSIQKPYNNGEDYFADINERYEKGEFFHADSIKFNDSLTYKTAKGRTVYGGGGIMPDYFVPYDTTMNTAYYGHLVSSRAIRKFAIEYYLEHENELNNTSLDEYISSFRITDRMLQNIVENGRSLDVEFNPGEYKTSLPLLKAHTKAEISSLIWDENGYFSVMNPVSNEIYIKAQELFNEATLLAEAY